MSEEKKEKNSSTEKNENLNTLTYEELAEKVETLKEESLRSRAELENFKKRSSTELSNTLKFANSEILSSLIPIVTSLEKALENSVYFLLGTFQPMHPKILQQSSCLLKEQD